SVGLSGEDRLKVAFTMPARAINLNKHGAAVQLSRDLAVGSVVRLRNKNRSEVSARIVALLKASQGVSTYAVEFVEQDGGATNFWGISFPVERLAARSAQFTDATIGEAPPFHL